MVLDLKTVGKAGLVWGIIGLALMLLITVLGGLVPASFGLEGLSLVGYAALFAGVHYGLRSPGMIIALVGGALAGALAALIIMLVSQFVPFVGGGGFTVQGLVGGFIAGLCGGVGIKLAQRF